MDLALSTIFIVHLIVTATVGIISRDVFSITIFYVSILIAVSLLMIGILSLVRSSQRILLFSGIASFYIFIPYVYNIAVIAIAYDFSVHGDYAVLANLIISLSMSYLALTNGIYVIGQYRLLSTIQFVKPTSEIFKKMKSIVEPVTKSKVRKHEDYIELCQGRTIWRGRTIWKGKLDVPYCIFVNRNTAQVFFLRPEEFNITLRSKVRPRKQQNIKFQIKDSYYDAIMGPISWQRYESWLKSI
ncbi:MAG: hypothetical protein JSV77_08335 [Dehalococcoidales bacterium]|nr:MAG: hypothetical protein JSV77_08335 [Dehalococcoidales bacterium]